MNELKQMHASPVTASTPKIIGKELSAMIAKLPGWEMHTKKGENRIEKSFAFKDFDQAVAFTNKVAQIANAENHHPAILTEWGKVTVTWWTHKIKGLSTNDFILAAKTDAVAGKVRRVCSHTSQTIPPSDRLRQSISDSSKTVSLKQICINRML